MHRLPHPKGVGTQKPKVFTRVISIFQLFGRVLQYLSDWLITRRHSYPYLRGWFRGFYRGCAVYWGPFWLSMFPFVHLYFFLNVFVVCCTAVWPCSHSCVIKLSVCVQRLSVIVFFVISEVYEHLNSCASAVILITACNININEDISVSFSTVISVYQQHLPFFYFSHLSSLFCGPP